MNALFPELSKPQSEREFCHACAFKADKKGLPYELSKIVKSDVESES